MTSKLITSIILAPAMMLAGITPSDSTAAFSTTNGGSFWSMAKLGGNIGYIIMGILALGIFLILYKWLQLFMDNRGSTPIKNTVFSRMSIEDIEKRAHQKNLTILGSTICHLIDFHQAGGKAAHIHNELVFYMGQENEKFETYRSWLHFLSDSAGALGLMGTVWGVFLTFFGGNMDSEKILNGMGVALITTLIGLVVSLIINLFNTQINGVFQRRLEMVTRKADELRLFLLHSEHRNIPKPLLATDQAPQKRQAPDSAVQAIAGNPFPELSVGPLLKIMKIRSETIAAGEFLKNALQLQVKDRLGLPLAGAKIVVRSEGALLLKNKKSAGLCITDKNGLAGIDIEAAETAGKGQLVLQLEKFSNSRQVVNWQVTPSKPDNIKIVNGNDQLAAPNTILPKPLQLLITDQFGNLVADAPVRFKLTMGDGSFQGGNHQVCARSDLKGIAESRLKLSAETGFHAVHAYIEGNNQKSVEFRILSKA